MALRSHWQTVQHYAHKIDLVVVIICILLLLCFIVHRLKSRQSA